MSKKSPLLVSRPFLRPRGTNEKSKAWYSGTSLMFHHTKQNTTQSPEVIYFRLPHQLHASLSTLQAWLFDRHTTIGDVRVLKSSCHLISSFSLKNSQSIVTSKHIQHSSWPESGLHLCFPSSRLSRHTLQTSQWNDLSLWILFKTKNIKDSERLIHFLQLYVNETLTEPIILMFPIRPNVFSCRKALIFNAIISNLHSHVPIIHLTQWSRI